MSEQETGCRCGTRSPDETVAFCDPDCVKCMRQKLRATCMVVFFRSEDGWRLASYQGDKPQSDAEIEFYCMLREGVPEVVEAYEEGLLLTDNRAIETTLPGVKGLLAGTSVIAARVSIGSFYGVRIAWRDSSDPFTEEELAIIQCVGNCPQGCEPLPCE